MASSQSWLEFPLALGFELFAAAGATTGVDSLLFIFCFLLGCSSIVGGCAFLFGHWVTLTPTD